jgi:hypothetical protein
VLSACIRGRIVSANIHKGQRVTRTCMYFACYSQTFYRHPFYCSLVNAHKRETYLRERPTCIFLNKNEISCIFLFIQIILFILDSNYCMIVYLKSKLCTHTLQARGSTLSMERRPVRSVATRGDRGLPKSLMMRYYIHVLTFIYV